MLERQPGRPHAPLVRDQQNFVAGCVLIAVTAFGWYASSDLDLGQLGQMGPGMLPRGILACIGLCGVALVVGAFLNDGARVSLPDFSAVLLIAALGFAALAATAMFGGTSGTLLGMPFAGAVFCGLYIVTMLALVVISAGRPGWLDRSGLRGPIFVLGGIVAFALTVSSVGLIVAGPLLALISGAGTPDIRFKELLVFALAMTLLSIGLFKYALQLPMPVLIIPGVIYL